MDQEHQRETAQAAYGVMSNWSDEETDDPIHADRRNFYKVERRSRDGQRVVDLVFAGTSLDKAKRIFDRMTKRRPRIKLTLRQRTRVLEQLAATQQKPQPALQTGQG